MTFGWLFSGHQAALFVGLNSETQRMCSYQIGGMLAGTLTGRCGRAGLPDHKSQGSKHAILSCLHTLGLLLTEREYYHCGGSIGTWYYVVEILRK